MEKSTFGYALAANTDVAARSFKCGATRLATSNLRGIAADDQSGGEPAIAIFDVSRPAGGSPPVVCAACPGDHASDRAAQLRDLIGLAQDRELFARGERGTAVSGRQQDRKIGTSLAYDAREPDSVELPRHDDITEHEIKFSIAVDRAQRGLGIAREFDLKPELAQHRGTDVGHHRIVLHEQHQPARDGFNVLLLRPSLEEVG